VIIQKPPPPLLQQIQSKAAPQTLVYSGPNNVYIKTYHQQGKSLQMPQSANKSDGTTESAYSTPVNNISKKLVYEVIV
jgi:hypothetical protein